MDISNPDPPRTPVFYRFYDCNRGGACFCVFVLCASFQIGHHSITELPANKIAAVGEKQMENCTENRRKCGLLKIEA